jgi:hypothetical protein
MNLRIEGAILSPDVLDRLDNIQGQKPSDFGFSFFILHTSSFVSLSLTLKIKRCNKSV